MNNQYKIGIGIIILIIFVIGIGIAYDLSQSNTPATTEVTTPVQTSNTQPSGPSWHVVANYSGVDDVNEVYQFNIRGDHFQINYTATPNPTVDYTYPRSFTIDLEDTDGSNPYDYETLNWAGEDTPLTTRNGSVDVVNNNNTYQIRIHPESIIQWNVVIWDYY